MSKNHYKGIDSYVVQQARFYSLRLIRKNYYSSNDFDDLVQEFILYYLRYGDNYDSARSSFKHFVQIMFNSCACNLIDRRAGVPRARSLDEPGEDGQTEGDSLASESPFSMVDLKITIERLPGELREICFLLADDFSIAEISRKLGRSTKSIYKKLKKIKKYFSNGGS
jgi:DNA-directed RNA polymerase specialized sigma24 family protein